MLVARAWLDGSSVGDGRRAHEAGRHRAHRAGDLGVGLPESDCVECKRSDIFAAKILKTVCAFANNNYNNCELGLLFIGVDEVDDPSRGAKAVPTRSRSANPIGFSTEGI